MNLGKIHNNLFLLTLFAFFVIESQAQEQPAAAANPPRPCLEDKRFGEFDFWLGDWEVHDGQGTFAGTNTIERAHGGCVLIENWQSVGGGTGMSVNYLDMVSGQWIQIWNDGGGNQINIRGGLTEEGMLLEGTIHYVASNTTAAFRGLWTALPDGRVRQFFEQSNDDGETWNTWFEGFYSKTPAE